MPEVENLSGSGLCPMSAIRLLLDSSNTVDVDDGVGRGLTWNVETSDGGEVFSPRAGHTSTVSGDKVFVFGGRRSEGSGLLARNYLDDFLVYDAEMKIWCRVTPIGASPSARAGHTVVAFEKNLILYGGYSHEEDLNDVWFYHTQNNVWTEMTTINPPPDGRFGHSAVVYTSASANGGAGEAGMYIFGGFHKGCLDSLCRMDLRSLVWTYPTTVEGHPHPGQRDGHVAAAHGDSMFVFSGYDAFTNMCDMWTYSIPSNEWAPVKPTGDRPTGRYSLAGAVHDNKWLIQGGYSHGIFRNDLHQFDFNTSVWTRINIEPSQLPRVCYHSASVRPNSNKLLLLGGLSGGEVCRTSNNIHEVEYTLPQESESGDGTSQAEIIHTLTMAYLDLQNKVRSIDGDKQNLISSNQELKAMLKASQSDMNFIMTSVQPNELSDGK